MSLYPPYGVPRQLHPLQPHPAMHVQQRPAVHVNQQQQQLQQHQMQLHNDPNAFRHYYASQLTPLTFNSRPIIQNLSMIAQQFPQWSGIVTQCIDEHIRRVPPHMKLPAFYLLDSICKNVYQEYAPRFAPVVTAMFLQAYHSVDPQTQAKMEEMLVTWRNGAPGGRELFGVGPQVEIESTVFSGHGAGPSQPRFVQHHQPPPISKKQVLAELEVALAHKERLLQSNPYDQLSAQQADTLQQLRNMVQYTDIAPQDLVAIQTQLASMAPPPPQPVASGFQDSYAHFPSNISLAQAAPEVPAGFGAPSVLAASQPVEAPSLLKIYDALLKAGIVNSAPGSKAPTPPPVRDPALEAELAYESMVMSMDVARNSSELSRKRPPIISVLFRRLPSQCKQCSLRFAGDESGKKMLQDHLDQHFKQNMRAQQQQGRGHSRSWFVGRDDWTTEKLGGKGKAKADALGAEEERQAKLRAAFVIIPRGDEAKNMQCPVCKEHIKTEFQEDDEEWVWRNAIKVNDRVYHATCHADAFVQNPLLARLKQDAVQRSRSQTPEHSSTILASSSVRTSLSPGAEPRGVKRKAEDDGTVIKQEERTPPLKRVALDASA